MGKTVPTLESFGPPGEAPGPTAAETAPKLRQHLIDEAFEEWKWVQRLNEKLNRMAPGETKRRERVWSKNEWHHARMMRAFVAMTREEQEAYHRLTAAPYGGGGRTRRGRPVSPRPGG